MMDRDDIVDLLTIISVLDDRSVGLTDVLTWHQLIGHLDKDDVSDAIQAHFAQRPDVRLQPGHVIERVKAVIRDRLDRMDPDERQEAVDASVRTDRYGIIDKSAPEPEDYPAEWTPGQRVSAYWEGIQDYRDEQEYAQAIGKPHTLSTSRPATEEVRAAALTAFANRQLSIDEDDPDSAVPYVNVLLVACPFCKSGEGEPCMKPGRPGQREKLTNIAGHPARITAAALAKGFSKDQADALVNAATARQTKKIRGEWQPSDRPTMAPQHAGPVTPAAPVDTSPERGAEVAASGEHEPKQPEPQPEEIPGGGWRDEKGALHFPDSENLDLAWARRHDEVFGR